MLQFKKTNISNRFAGVHQQVTSVNKNIQTLYQGIDRTINKEDNKLNTLSPFTSHNTIMTLYSRHHD